MSIITPGTDLPTSPNFKKEEREKILRLVALGESLSLVSVSGMGKTSFLRFLISNFQTKKERLKNLHFLQVDLNDLAEVSSASFFKLLLSCSAESFEKLQPKGNLLNEAQAILQKGAFSNETTTVFSCLKQMLSLFSKNPNFTTVFILDHFGEIALKMNEEFFLNLKSLRHQHKHALSFVFSLHNDPYSLFSKRRPPEILCQNVLFLSLYKEWESLAVVESFEERTQGKFENKIKRAIVKFAGGHSGLLRDQLRFILREKPSEINKEDLLEDMAIKTRCQAILANLTLKQQKILVAISRGKRLNSQEKREATLLKKLFLIEEQKEKYQITIPLLEDFLKKKKIKAKRAIFIDPETDEVLIGGEPLKKALTQQEFKLLFYLYKHPGRVCSKDEIAENVWEGERGGVSDEAIDKLLQRLRAKIEEVKTKPQLLKTYHGRGYQLKN